MVENVGNQLLAGFGTTIFETNTRLAVAHDSINLGQGFPDEEGPDSMKALAGRYMFESSNQYPSMMVKSTAPCFTSPLTLKA